MIFICLLICKGGIQEIKLKEVLRDGERQCFLGKFYYKKLRNCYVGLEVINLLCKLYKGKRQGKYLFQRNKFNVFFMNRFFENKVFSYRRIGQGNLVEVLVFLVEGYGKYCGVGEGRSGSDFVLECLMEQQ